MGERFRDMNKIIDGLIKIKCPHCNAEYLPSEIFDPTTFFGNPKIIDRSEDGKHISMITGTGMNLTERFICDVCLTEFEIKAEFSTGVNEIKHHCFSENFTTKLK